MTEKSKLENSLPRRGFIKTALFGFVAIPLASLGVAKRIFAAALDEKDPQAKALGYVTDASRVDAKSNPTFQPGQACANCLQLTANGGCNLFPGKTVATGGWCKAWVKKR